MTEFKVQNRTKMNKTLSHERKQNETMEGEREQESFRLINEGGNNINNLMKSVFFWKKF